MMVYCSASSVTRVVSSYLTERFTKNLSHLSDRTSELLICVQYQNEYRHQHFKLELMLQRLVSSFVTHVSLHKR